MANRLLSLKGFLINVVNVKNFGPRVKFVDSRVQTMVTPPIAEIIWVKNVRAIVVCGFLIKWFEKKYPENLKKIVGAV